MSSSTSNGEPARDSRLFFIGRRCGRLANRLVLAANFMALVEERGYRLVNLTLHSYAHLFEATQQDIYCRYPAPQQRSRLHSFPRVMNVIRRTRTFFHVVNLFTTFIQQFPVFGRRVAVMHELPGKRVTQLDDPRYGPLIENARIVLVDGWKFRAPDYVRRHAPKIRAYFRPVAAYENAGREAVDRLRRKADIVIGVHVRMTDYRHWKGGRYFFKPARYAAWMKELAEQFPGRRVAFLVCSDEPRSADEFPGLTVGFGAGSPLGDNRALAGCDYILGPVSTFSQWASFYGNVPLFFLRSGDAKMDPAKFQVSFLEEVP
jgi:hypothetical protein